jgi:hypothetical protein
MPTRHDVKAFREKENKNSQHSRLEYYKNLADQGQLQDALLQVKYEGNLSQCRSIKNIHPLNRRLDRPHSRSGRSFASVGNPKMIHMTPNPYMVPTLTGLSWRSITADN